MPTPSNVVQETTDYEQFSFIENNREPNRGHIEALKTAFEEMGNLTRVQPILVNRNFEIIDGQHRFIAAKELEQPVFYTLVPGLGVAEARSMNILHRSWKVEDFTRSYALGGNTNYQEYLNLKEDYGFVHSIMLSYVFNGETTGQYASFREGDFVLEDKAGTKTRLDVLALCAEVTSLAKTKPFALAMLRALNTEGFSIKQMVKKLQLHPELIKRMGSVNDTLRMLEDIYNYKVYEANRLRFF